LITCSIVAFSTSPRPWGTGYHKLRSTRADNKLGLRPNDPQRSTTGRMGPQHSEAAIEARRALGTFQRRTTIAKAKGESARVLFPLWLTRGPSGRHCITERVTCSKVNGILGCKPAF